MRIFNPRFFTFNQAFDEQGFEPGGYEFRV